jgi:tetratricopeptide (TPR) repeat protein
LGLGLARNGNKVPPVSAISALGRKAMEQARRGEFDQALATVEAAIAEQPKDKGLRFFAALLHSRLSNPAAAAAQLREALELAPGDALVRAELARTLVGTGELDEAEALLGQPGIPTQDERRIRAMIAASRGDQATAAELYREIVAADPRDFESWGNLGIALLAADDAAAAIPALEQALRLRPGNSRLMDKWAEAQAAAGTADSALPLLYTRGDSDPAAFIAAARLEDLEGRPERAVDALRSALEADPGNGAALVALAELHERSNAIDELETTLQRLETLSPAPDKLPLLRARAAYRRHDFPLALRLAEQASPAVDRAARAQLLGQVHDRLGDYESAFAAFAEMNATDALATHDAAGKAEGYLAGLSERLAVLTGDWIDRWPPPPPPGPSPEPVFLLGFPRSGTTLLDTLLMSEPRLAVSEENPMLTDVSKQVGSFERIAALGPADIESLRKLYFAQAHRYLPDLADRQLVDKFPLGIAAAALIHRLFPTARILFLRRHPCDVVLSCFMTRFQPTDLGSAFLTLDGAARLYDSAMALWARSRELLPLRVLDVAYESLVGEPAAEMKRVADFLEIPWSHRLLDNRPSAATRGFINTPSYAQVSEPIYRRAVERWRNYAGQMEPVLPILKPGVESLGYDA